MGVKEAKIFTAEKKEITGKERYNKINAGSFNYIKMPILDEFCSRSTIYAGEYFENEYDIKTESGLAKAAKVAAKKLVNGRVIYDGLKDSAVQFPEKINKMLHNLQYTRYNVYASLMFPVEGVTQVIIKHGNVFMTVDFEEGANAPIMSIQDQTLLVMDNVWSRACVFGSEGIAIKWTDSDEGMKGKSMLTVTYYNENEIYRDRLEKYNPKVAEQILKYWYA